MSEQPASVARLLLVRSAGSYWSLAPPLILGLIGLNWTGRVGPTEFSLCVQADRPGAQPGAQPGARGRGRPGGLQARLGGGEGEGDGVRTRGAAAGPSEHLLDQAGLNKNDFANENLLQVTTVMNLVAIL
jgi:hypothetical protein